MVDPTPERMAPMNDSRMDAPGGSASKTMPMEPVVSPSSPASLEGVKIEGCVFTEMVAKREPRPPLIEAAYTGNINLDMPDFLVHLKNGPRFRLGQYGYMVPYPGAVIPKERNHFTAGARPYTGPITPSMWAIIRKWWTP